MKGRNQIYLVTAVFGVLFLMYGMQTFNGPIPTVGRAIPDACQGPIVELDLPDGTSGDDPFQFTARIRGLDNAGTTVNCQLTGKHYQTNVSGTWEVIPPSGDLNCIGNTCFDSQITPPFDWEIWGSKQILCETPGRYYIRGRIQIYTGNPVGGYSVYGDPVAIDCGIPDQDVGLCSDLYCDDGTCFDLGDPATNLVFFPLAAQSDGVYNPSCCGDDSDEAVIGSVGFNRNVCCNGAFPSPFYLRCYQFTCDNGDNAFPEFYDTACGLPSDNSKCVYDGVLYNSGGTDGVGGKLIDIRESGGSPDKEYCLDYGVGVGWADPDTDTDLCNSLGYKGFISESACKISAVDGDGNIEPGECNDLLGNSQEFCCGDDPNEFVGPDGISCYDTPQNTVSCGGFIISEGKYSLAADEIFNGDTCINIPINNVKLDCNNYKITGSGSNKGIILSGGNSNVTIINCEIDNFDLGIQLSGTSSADSITFTNNNLGLILNTYAKVTNSIFDSNQKGIVLGSTGSKTVKDNQFKNSGTAGIIINTGVSDSLIQDNIFDSNNQGILFITTSFTSPIPLDSNTVTGNTFIQNTYGIYFDDQTSSDITNNRIYNNLFDNANNIGMVGTIDSNIWNVAPVAGTNIVGGPYIAGNYWATPLGDGISETCFDSADFNGICDSGVKTIAPNNVDNSPLATPGTSPAITSVSPKYGSSKGGFTLTLTTQNFDPSYNISLGLTTYSSNGAGITDPYSVSGNTVTFAVPSYTGTRPPVGADDIDLILKYSPEQKLSFSGLFSWAPPITVTKAAPATLYNKPTAPINITFETASPESGYQFNILWNVTFAGRTYRTSNKATASNYVKANLTNVTITLPSGDYSRGDAAVTINTLQGPLTFGNVFTFCGWSCTGWGTCSSDTQSRTCTNNCVGFTQNKPSESQSCSESDPPDDPPDNPPGNGPDEKIFVTSSPRGDIIKIEVTYKSYSGLRVDINTMPVSTYSATGEKVYSVYQIIASEPNDRIIEGKIYFTVSATWMLENNVEARDIRVYSRPSNGGRWSRLLTQTPTANSFISHTTGFSDFVIAFETSSDNGGDNGDNGNDGGDDGGDNGDDNGDGDQDDTKEFPWIYVWIGLGILIAILAAVFLLQMYNGKAKPKTKPLYAGIKATKPRTQVQGNRRVVLHPHSPLGKRHIRPIHKAMSKTAKPTIEEQGQIKKYIDSAIDKHFSLLKIREKLLKTGWDKQTIDMLLAQENKKHIAKAQNELDDLRHYVKICRDKKITEPKIRKVLEQAGWRQITINEVLQEVK